MDIMELIRARHSTREFSPRKISAEDIEKLLEAARLAPSACNLQLTEYIAIDDDGLILRLQKEVSEKFSWAPNFIVVIYNPRFTRHRYADAQSAGMAVENILLAATSLGIASCPMAGFENDDVLKRILQIPKEYKIALIVALGYEDGTADKERERLPLKEIAHKNFYKKNNFLKFVPDIKKWSTREVIDYRRRIAPVYLYKNHFRLGNFDKQLPLEAVKAIAPQIAAGSRVLDLLSYDLDFARKLADLAPKAKIFFSDYLPYILKIAKETSCGAETAKISEEDEIEIESGSIDAVTCVAKLEFMANLPKIISEVGRVLKPNGKFFVIVFGESFLKRVARFFCQKIIGANVYYKNSFYKTGPWKLVGGKIDRLAEQSGLKKIEERRVLKIGNYNFFLRIFKNFSDNTLRDR